MARNMRGDPWGARSPQYQEGEPDDTNIPSTEVAFNPTRDHARNQPLATDARNWRMTREKCLEIPQRPESPVVEKMTFAGHMQQIKPWLFKSDDADRTFVLVADGKKLYVCLEWLASHSKWFLDLKQELQSAGDQAFETKQNIVFNGNQTFETFCYFLTYLQPASYPGKQLLIAGQFVLQLMQFAGEYKVATLMNDCESFLIKTLHDFKLNELRQMVGERKKGTILLVQHGLDTLTTGWSYGSKYGLRSLQEALIKRLATMSVDQVVQFQANLDYYWLFQLYLERNRQMEARLMDKAHQMRLDKSWNYVCPDCDSFVQNGKACCDNQAKTLRADRCVKCRRDPVGTGSNASRCNCYAKLDYDPCNLLK